MRRRKKRTYMVRRKKSMHLSLSLSLSFSFSPSLSLTHTHAHTLSLALSLFLARSRSLTRSLLLSLSLAFALALALALTLSLCIYHSRSRPRSRSRSGSCSRALSMYLPSRIDRGFHRQIHSLKHGCRVLIPPPLPPLALFHREPRRTFRGTRWKRSSMYVKLNLFFISCVNIFMNIFICVHVFIYAQLEEVLDIRETQSLFRFLSEYVYEYIYVCVCTYICIYIYGGGLGERGLQHTQNPIAFVFSV